MSWKWNVEFVDVAANGDDLTGGQYDYVLLQLRTRLEEDCVRAGGNSCPVLPQYTSGNNNIRWFEIRLYINQTTRIRLRLRRDDLYLHGYQVNDQQWREFGVEGTDPHLINGSQLLGYTGSYTDLTRESGLRLNQVTVGSQSLITAARSLANQPSRRDEAKALMVMILMFSEAARFVPVQNFIQRTFYTGATITDWIDRLIHRWGTLSGNVMYYTTHPDDEWQQQTLTIEGPGPYYEIIDVVARTVGQMLFYFGILQNNPDNIKPSG